MFYHFENKTKFMPERNPRGDRPQSIRDGSGSEIDRLFSVLRSQRRRYVIYCLQTTSGNTVTVDDLATTIVNWETESASEPSDDHLSEVEIGLHHNHLPNLEELGLIAFDPRSGSVRVQDTLPNEVWLAQVQIEELDSDGQDDERVRTALTSVLKTAYDNGISLDRSYSCHTDPPYPNWDVTITEVR